MESLLGLSFDNLSSRDSTRVHKGLRQIDGLLAQVCLSTTKLSPHKRTQSDGRRQHAACKPLRDLRKDAAFREFFRLQEGFQWNVASRLIAALERLMGQPSSEAIDSLLLATLETMQGLLLLHPPSRTLFNREDYMNLLLDLLDCGNPADVQSQALLVLVTALLDQPRNTRVFEQVDGLLTVTSLFKGRTTSTEVKMRTLEFLYFYLMPEARPTAAASAPNTAVRPRSASQRHVLAAEHARTHAGDTGAGDVMDIDESGGGGGDEEAGRSTATRNTAEKQKLLARHLNNVAELVRDLQENAVFGAHGGASG